eukprot:scaffold7283_cov41-Cyclotella_meneghiniana.AAC.4
MMSEACHPKPHLTSRILSIKSSIETAHCSTSASTRASRWRLSSILSRCMIPYTQTAYSISPAAVVIHGRRCCDGAVTSRIQA